LTIDEIDVGNKITPVGMKEEALRKEIGCV
jgi:hypothetical protein